MAREPDLNMSGLIRMPSKGAARGQNPETVVAETASEGEAPTPVPVPAEQSPATGT